MLKLFVLLLCTWATGYRLDCNKNTVLRQLNVPTYDFSVRLLDRVGQETDGHFVFSPISTWLQLLAIADGAQGKTLNEVLTVTRQNTLCSRQIVRQIFNSLDAESRETIQHESIFVIDKLLDVKEPFVNEVELLKSAKVRQVSFNAKSVKLNEIFDGDMTDKVTDMFETTDFKMTVLLIAELANMKVNWKNPFNPVHTQLEAFYSNDNVIRGYVNMMNQIEYFNYNDIPEIDAKAIELPFTDRTSMILLQPTKGNAEDLFLKMKDTRMASILRLLNVSGSRLLNLKMPRINITTDIDNVPELLFDMGLQRMFTPRLAEFKKISDYRVYVSMMMNRHNIEVTETGVTASIAPGNIIRGKGSIDVTFNKPFVFLLMDKVTNVILFGGIYSKPSIV